MEGGTGGLLLIRGNAADGSLIAPTVVAETAAETDADGWLYWQPGGVSRRIERWGRINRREKSAD